MKQILDWTNCKTVLTVSFQVRPSLHDCLAKPKYTWFDLKYIVFSLTPVKAPNVAIYRLDLSLNFRQTIQVSVKIILTEWHVWTVVRKNLPTLLVGAFLRGVI